MIRPDHRARLRVRSHRFDLRPESRRLRLGGGRSRAFLFQRSTALGQRRRERRIRRRRPRAPRHVHARLAQLHLTASLSEQQRGLRLWKRRRLGARCASSTTLEFPPRLSDETRELRVAKGHVRALLQERGDDVSQRGEALVDVLRLLKSSAGGSEPRDALGTGEVDEVQPAGDDPTGAVHALGKHRHDAVRPTRPFVQRGSGGGATRCPPP